MPRQTHLYHSAAHLYPSNAGRGGATTLTGSGSASDEFLFASPCIAIVQNNTGATIYVMTGPAAAVQATQGDEAVPAGAEFISPNQTNFVSIYGAAGTTVNGTTSGGLVIYGVQ